MSNSGSFNWRAEGHAALEARAQQDRTALARLRDGDADALGEIVHRYGKILLRVATVVSGSPESAQDIVQDVFFRVWRQRDTLGAVDQLGAYLARAVRNQARNVLREQRSTAARDERWSHDAVQFRPVAYNTAEAHLAAESLRETVDRALRTVPRRCREIFLMHWEDDLPQPEIARLLGISLATVHNQVSRAMRAVIASVQRPPETSAP